MKEGGQGRGIEGGGRGRQGGREWDTHTHAGVCISAVTLAEEAAAAASAATVASPTAAVSAAASPAAAVAPANPGPGLSPFVFAFLNAPALPSSICYSLPRLRCFPLCLLLLFSCAAFPCVVCSFFSCGVGCMRRVGGRITRPSHLETHMCFCVGARAFFFFFSFRAERRQGGGSQEAQNHSVRLQAR